MTVKAKHNLHYTEQFGSETQKIKGKWALEGRKYTYTISNNIS